MKVRPGMTAYICGQCGGEFFRYACDIAAADRQRIKAGKEPPKVRYCGKSCANLASPRHGRPVGWRDKRIEATEIPTTVDIAWAAGIYEGEGNVSDRVLQVTQKDTWLLYRLSALFGGSVRPRFEPNPCYHWSVSGSRKRDFAAIIYDHLSPRRQAQIDSARSLPRW